MERLLKNLAFFFFGFYAAEVYNDQAFMWHVALWGALCYAFAWAYRQSR